MKRTQSGLSMVGFLITLTLAIFFLFCGMKIVPMYIEYYSVKEALKDIANTTESTPATKDQIRVQFAKHLEMSYANYVKSLNVLRFESDGQSGKKMVVDYERREPLFWNLDVVGKFHAEQVLPRGTSGSDAE